VSTSASIDHLRIATPCPVSWEQMSGDNRVRFCDHCQLNVYNISELSRIEAVSLIASTEGRLCAKLYRRADGTVLTRDCPVGLRALRMRLSKRAAAVFAAIVSLTGAAFGQDPAGKNEKTTCTPRTRITRSQTPAEKSAHVLSGNVVDPHGAAVPGAKVIIVNADNKETTATTTDNAGRFEFELAKAGTYSVTVELIGFKSVDVNNVVIRKDQRTNIDTILELNVYTETIGIMDSSFEAFDTHTPGTTIISEQMLRRLPIQ
jgi:hypothetical protein